jgi:hypothetical protein
MPAPLLRSKPGGLADGGVFEMPTREKSYSQLRRRIPEIIGKSLKIIRYCNYWFFVSQTTYTATPAIVRKNNWDVIHTLSTIVHPAALGLQLGSCHRPGKFSGSIDAAGSELLHLYLSYFAFFETNHSNPITYCEG